MINNESMKKIILIVDDDTQLQQIYKEHLSVLGELLIARTGADALQLARDHKPDLVVLDVMLPSGMNGFDVLRELKRDEILKRIPVLMLTNLDTEKQAALDMGAADYLVKVDVSMEEIVTRIKKLLGA